MNEEALLHRRAPEGAVPNSAAENGPARAGLESLSNAGSRRNLPSVEKVLQGVGSLTLPRALVVDVIRREIAKSRRQAEIPDLDTILEGVHAALARLQRDRLQPVINGTGILLHTNLGRAPLAAGAMEALKDNAAGYTNLEYDLVEGGRGCRASYLEHSLALLCGAEAATVVNNCAAALVLVLRHFTRNKSEVVISRGELVQIGGGFRIPEILEASGARLREVGTTNKTALQDYVQAIGPETAMLLRVHRSNFLMEGFVESPASAALAALARKHRLPLIEDLGSGIVFRTNKIPGLEREPTPSEMLECGVDLVTFSGDKFLGGPQAGIIAGKATRVSALKREPFFRALRCDKLVLSALQATVEVYLQGTPEKSIPILVLLHASEAELRARAEKLRLMLARLPLQARVGRGNAQIGGGSLPRSTIPSVTLDLLPTPISLSDFAARLRLGSPPLIGYVSGGRFKLDLRTIFPTQDEMVANAIRRTLTERFGGPE